MSQLLEALQYRKCIILITSARYGTLTVLQKSCVTLKLMWRFRVNIPSRSVIPEVLYSGLLVERLVASVVHGHGSSLSAPLPLHESVRTPTMAESETKCREMCGNWCKLAGTVVSETNWKFERPSSRK